MPWYDGSRGAQLGHTWEALRLHSGLFNLNKLSYFKHVPELWFFFPFHDMFYSSPTTLIVMLSAHLTYFYSPHSLTLLYPLPPLTQHKWCINRTFQVYFEVRYLIIDPAAGEVGGVMVFTLIYMQQFVHCVLWSWEWQILYFHRNLGLLLNIVLQSVPEKLLCLHNALRKPMSILLLLLLFLCRAQCETNTWNSP